MSHFSILAFGFAVFTSTPFSLFLKVYHSVRSLDHPFQHLHNTPYNTYLIPVTKSSSRCWWNSTIHLICTNYYNIYSYQTYIRQMHSCNNFHHRHKSKYNFLSPHGQTKIYLLSTHVKLIYEYWYSTTNFQNLRLFSLLPKQSCWR